MEPARIVRTPDHLADGEEWDRRTDDDDIRAVSATCLDAGSRWPWQVGVAAAGHVRAEPLEAQLRGAVAEALRSVPG